MDVNIFSTHEELSASAANELANHLQQHPGALVCLASGDTPKEMYKRLVEIIRQQQIDTRQVQFVGLDEWLGIEPGNEGSCRYFFEKYIIEPLHLMPQQFVCFDAMTTEPELECKKMNDYINKKGGISFMVVGIGMNGHIGFNEPGVSKDLYAHVIDLDETTQHVGQKYFSSHTVIRKGITLGLRHVLETGRVLLLANGLRKAPVIAQALQFPANSRLPASWLKLHPNASFMLDADAASQI